MKNHVFLKKCFAFFLILVCVIPYITLAVSSNFNMPDWEDSKIDSADDYGVIENVGNVLGGTLYIVRIVGVGIALVILLVIACKYMFASAGDRAEIKKHAVPYVVGAVVMIGASGILTVLIDFSANI